MWYTLPEIRNEFLLRILGLCSSLKHVLHHSRAKMLFARFLASEHSLENLNFLDAVIDYKTRCKNLCSEERKQKACEIVHKYLKPSSPYQVNVPETMVRQCKYTLHETDWKFDCSGQRNALSAFDECHTEICKLLEQGPFVRFKKSGVFYKFLDDIRAYEVDYVKDMKAKDEFKRRGSYAPPPESMFDVMFSNGS